MGWAVSDMDNHAENECDRYHIEWCLLKHLILQGVPYFGLITSKFEVIGSDCRTQSTAPMRGGSQLTWQL
jgi:hypothetical protein